MWPKKEGGSPCADFIIITAVFCVVPIHFIVGHRFVEPGPGGKGVMDNLRVVKIKNRVAGHTVPGGIQILDMMFTQGIQTILVRGNRTGRIIVEQAK